MAKPKGKGSHAASVEAADKHPGASRGPTPSAAISRPDALDRFFALSAQGTNIATEFRAGLATFLTMAYIMFVNPAILEKAGMDVGAVFVAACLASAEGSIVMGLYANYPIALAPGMGLNAYFAFTVVPELGGNWQLALGCVFISGVLFFALSLSPLRERLADRCSSDEFEARHRRRHWTVPCSDRLATCGHVAHDTVTLVTPWRSVEDSSTPRRCRLSCHRRPRVAENPRRHHHRRAGRHADRRRLGLEPWHGFVARPPSLAPTFLKMNLAGALNLSLIVIVLTLLLVTGLTALVVAAFVLLSLFLAPLAQTVLLTPLLRRSSSSPA